MVGVEGDGVVCADDDGAVAVAAAAHVAAAWDDDRVGQWMMHKPGLRLEHQRTDDRLVPQSVGHRQLCWEQALVAHAAHRDTPLRHLVAVGAAEPADVGDDVADAARAEAVGVAAAAKGGHTGNTEAELEVVVAAVAAADAATMEWKTPRMTVRRHVKVATLDYDSCQQGSGDLQHVSRLPHARQETYGQQPL